MSQKSIVSSPFAELALGVQWWGSWHFSLVCQRYDGQDDLNVFWMKYDLVRWPPERINLGKCGSVMCWVRDGKDDGYNTC